MFFFFCVVFDNLCTVTLWLNFPTLYYTNLLTVAKNSKESLLQALELAFLSQCVKFIGVYIISGPFLEDGCPVFSMLTLLLSKCETLGWTTCDLQRLSSLSETLMSPNTTQNPIPVHSLWLSEENAELSISLLSEILGILNLHME